MKSIAVGQTQKIQNLAESKFMWISISIRFNRFHFIRNLIREIPRMKNTSNHPIEIFKYEIEANIDEKVWKWHSPDEFHNIFQRNIQLIRILFEPLTLWQFNIDCRWLIYLFYNFKGQPMLNEANNRIYLCDSNVFSPSAHRFRCE